MSPKTDGPNTSVGNIPDPATPQASLRAAPPSVKIQHMDLLDMQALDQSTLDPDRHYRWVRTTKDDQATGLSVTRHKLRGYATETFRDGGPRTLAEAPPGEDGTIRMGDLVLMSCPKTQRQERVLEIQKATDQRLDANTVTTEDQAKRLGVKIIKGE